MLTGLRHPRQEHFYGIGYIHAPIPLRKIVFSFRLKFLLFFSVVKARASAAKDLQTPLSRDLRTAERRSSFLGAILEPGGQGTFAAAEKSSSESAPRDPRLGGTENRRQRSQGDQPGRGDQEKR